MQTIFKLDLASLLYFFSFIHVEMLRLLKSDWQHEFNLQITEN